MSLTVVGSVAFDALETPYGKTDRILGGAATHFSLAARFFTDVRVVGVVGDDFGEDEIAVFEERGINTEDLDRVAGAESFFWRGRYEDDMQVAHTLDTQLNVFAEFDPVLSPAARAASVVFLANIQPDVQRRVREQCTDAILAGLDSMNYWITSARESLLETMATVDIVVLNDAEVRMLMGESNLVRAANRIRELGPRVVIAKQGSYGAAMFTDAGFFSVPGYPLETIVDPTGAGDSFAGGFFGYLDRHAKDGVAEDELRCAVVYGSVLASFQIEAFGGERLYRLTHAEIEERMADFKRMTHFEPRTLAVRTGSS